MSDNPTILAGTYEIRQEIGSGGGGVVFLANHLRLNKPVVLKADKRGLSTNMDKLRREADALKRLSHTYIPQVYDFLVEDGSVYTVMDYIEGESFDKPLSRGERFSQPQVVRWMRQLLEAVAYLHSRPPYGILHSDIKPANVMLTPTGDICLIDFNIALALGAEGAVAVGASRGYASPEHYGAESLAEATGRKITVTESDKTVPITGYASTVRTAAPSDANVRMGKTVLLDARSDIYSLGATIYHILSGKRPASKARAVEPLPPGQYSDGLVQIIARAMDPDPERRYQTAAEMLDAVNRLHRTDPRWRRYLRSRTIAAAALSALLLTSASSAFVGLRRMEQTQNALVQAQYSARAFGEGNLDGALRYALAAIPERESLLTPPAPPQAANALADALGVYDLADGYKPHHVVELPSQALLLAVSPGGRYAAAVYAYAVAVIDLETGETTATLPAAASALAGAVFVDDNRLLYAGENGLTAYDIAARRELWRGRPATGIAVSADGKTIVAVDRDAGEALLYSAEGAEKGRVFFEGKRQRVPANDSFANPRDSLLALSRDGAMLAASFDDGSLDLFDLVSGEVIQVQPPSGATHFEGGFSGDFFAFSAVGVGEKSVFAAIDLQQLAQTGGFQADNPFGVLADESGVYISSENLLVRLDPATGEQREIAYAGADITGFAHGGRDFAVATGDNVVALYDDQANRMEEYACDTPPDFVQAAGEFAVIGGRSSPSLRICKRVDHAEADVFAYDAAYPHDEARINRAGDRVLLFSYQGFRLYTPDGALVCEVALPDAGRVYDQQYSPESGNLAVLYPDALRIYSGRTGAPVLERTGLQSVFYAPYGVSVLEPGGGVHLVDIDSGQTVAQAAATGDFAAICGRTVDRAFLDGRELIGAAKTDDGYLFAVSDGVAGAVYDGEGKERFPFAASGASEAFFVGEFVVISPQHGTPAVYRVSDGRKVRDLEPDSFMTYATAVGDYLVTEYVSADGERFGLLLDSRCETLARLPGLTDIAGETLRFDFRTGYLRETHIHTLQELTELAKGG